MIIEVRMQAAQYITVAGHIDKHAGHAGIQSLEVVVSDNGVIQIQIFDERPIARRGQADQFAMAAPAACAICQATPMAVLLDALDKMTLAAPK